MARPRAKLDRCGEADLVARRLDNEPPGARRERLLAVRMGLEGELGLERIAQAVGRSRAAIQTWFDTYRQGGVDALLHDARSDNPGRPSELSGLALAELLKDLEAGRWRSVPQMRRWLEQTHGVKLALSSLYDRLGKACARLRVPRKSHVKKDPAAPEAFRAEPPPGSSPWSSPPASPCACGCWTRCATACTASPGASGACPATGPSSPPSRSMKGAASKAPSAWA